MSNLYMYKGCRDPHPFKITGDGYRRWAFPSLPACTEHGLSSEFQVHWNPEKNRKFLEMAADGVKWEQIADHFYSTGSNMRFRYKTLAQKGLVKGPLRGITV